MQKLGQSYYCFTHCSIENGTMHLVLTGQNDAKIDVELSCSEAQQLVNRINYTVLEHSAKAL